MTIIKKMRLKGFKSFAKPIDLEFGNNFNCILGPNGSGKSNVMDALCFVFGEISAKSMRAEKSSNLIFNGGKIGSPAREAEVSIHFDNKNKEFPVDTKEVKITRIVKQKGLSTYKINDEKRTRQQILDLLSTAKIDAGNHNIVLQGDITRFMEMKADERREIIEDIAGISVYDEKKHQALNELERTETKLREVSIVLTERGTYLKELKKERDQALKFKQYESRVKSNKATDLFVQIKDKNKIKESIESQKDIIQQQLDKIDKQIKDVKEIINSKKLEIQKVNKEIEEKGEITQINLQKEIEEISTTVVKSSARADSLKSEIAKIKERKIQLQKDLEEISNKVLSLSGKKSTLENELEQSKKQEKLLEKSLEDTKDSFQDSLSYDTAVNKILESKIKGVHGIIAQLGSVDKKYQTAIGIISGGKIKSFVVEDDQVAAQCIRYLKQNKFGIATFLPLNKLRPRPFLNKHLLKNPGVIGLASDLINFDKKYEKAFNYIFGSTLVVKDVETARKIGIGNARMVTLDGDIFEQSGVIVGGFRKIRSFFFKTLKAKGGAEEEYGELRTRIIQTESDIKNISEQISRIHLPEKEKIAQIIKQHDKELITFEEELAGLSSNSQKQEKYLEEKRKQETKFYSDYKNLFSKRNKLSEEVQKLESKISTEEFKTKEFEKKINDTSIKRAKVTAELEGLNMEFEEFKGVKLRNNISREELKYEIQKYESLLRNMGNVNMKALEICEDIEKEYQELLSKVDKLRVEKEAVMQTMQEIEGKKKSIFLKTYKTIAENFKNIFIQLSAKGDAFLELENKENPLEGGIFIKVRLAGTKFLDIKSLSGGEKTMTALALIFAIQEYKPASFYLLDEVDAALDKTNSMLLSKFISKYAGKAQYIIISHNDQIITEADQIYGVSMQKNGISKVISLKI